MAAVGGAGTTAGSSGAGFASTTTVRGVTSKHDKSVVTDAKKRARGDLDLAEWSKQGWAFEAAAVKEPAPLGVMPYERAATLSVADFLAKYEVPNLPVMIGGIADGWPAVKHNRWTLDALYAAYRHRKFKCGEDDAGYPVKIKLKYFLRYMKSQRDDSPLYIFDSMFDDDKRSCGILHDYNVPKYFTDDLFKLVGEHRRPPYRWFLIGPARSGTTVHLDPLSTSAWNTLIAGRKRWVLFPPHFTREFVKGRHHVRKDRGEDDEAIDYFNNILPRIKAEGGPSVVSQMIEVVQRPGDTIFVPGGWWHAVMNLDDTIAVTQNFCSKTNFPRVWVDTRNGRRGMARKWLRVLQKEEPELAAVAAEINARDGWDMDKEATRHAARVAEKPAAEAAKRAAKQARKERREARKAAGGGGDEVSDSDSSTSSSSSSSSASSSSGSETSDSEAERCGKPKRSGGMMAMSSKHKGGGSMMGKDKADTGGAAAVPASKRRKIAAADSGSETD